MAEIERYDILVIGSGEAGKYLAWTMAKAGHRTVVVERKMIGGSCPNIACLPSKNVIHSAKAASLAERAAEFGVEGGATKTNMKAVQRRKRTMVEDLIQVHLDRYEASGAELLMGEARFVAPRTVTISRNDRGLRVLAGERVFLNWARERLYPI
jgi:pyruvate/2-oxoglutarate dehydrogenase complex dihydrolipoamide dehydrogenase (E3) component